MSEQNMPPLVITVKKAAELLALHPGTVYEMCYRNELKSVKIGRSRRVLYEDLQQWLQARQWASQQEFGSNG